MSVRIGGFAVLLVVLPALLVSLVVWLVSRATSDDGGAPARAARRHELLVSSLAVLAAVGTAVVLIAQPVAWPGWAPAPGIVQALSPFAVAVVLGVVRAVGELTWPRPRGAVRAAPLARRTVWSVGGTRLRWVLASALAMAAVLVVTGLTADDSGRAFGAAGTASDGHAFTTASGPYPGWPYGVPMLLGLAAAVIVTVAALRVITRRAPLHALPAAHDDAVRRTSAGRLLAVVQLCLGAALGLTTFLAGSAVRGVGSNLDLNGLDGGTHEPIGTVAMILGVLVLMASIVAALVGITSRRVPRSAPAPSAWAAA